MKVSFIERSKKILKDIMNDDFDFKKDYTLY